MSGMTTALRGMALLALGVALTTLPGHWGPGSTLGADPGVTYVVAQDPGTTSDFGTVNEALMVAEAGDSILIEPGTYAEAILIDKDITLSGIGPRELVVVAPSEEQALSAEGPAAMVTIMDTDAVLSNLTLTGAAAQVEVVGGAPTLTGLHFDGVGTTIFGEEGCHSNLGPTGCNPVSLSLSATRALLSGNTFENSGQIKVHGGASPTIVGNVMSGGAHVFLETPGDDTVVRGNTIVAAGNTAIAIYTTGRPLIEGNTILDAGTSGIMVGLQLAPGIAPIIRGNTISGSPTGIEVASGAEPTIDGNELSANGLAILVVGSDALVTGNSLHDNSGGIFIMQGSPTLEGNDISGGKVGVGLGSENAQPILTGNTICDNVTAVSLTFGAEMPETAGNTICPDAGT